MGRGKPGPALTFGIPLILLGATAFLVKQLVIDKNKATAGGEVAKGTLVVPQDDSGKYKKIRIAGDPWSGYSTFRNEPKLRTKLEKSYIRIEYLDNKEYYDQDKRMAALASGDLDLAVTTIDAFLQHGKKHRVGGQYPGVIVWNIDASNGGDAIFLAKDKKSFDDVGPRDVACFATGTPSEHLWDFASLSFSHLENVRTDNGLVAEDCWKKLKAGEVKIAVLWQPFTAIAEKEGYHKVFATGVQAPDVIVDIVVANRNYLNREAATIGKLAKDYFSTIDEYTKDVDAHIRFITEDCGEDCKGDLALGRSVLSGIDFLSYEKNMQLWWGKRGKQSKMPGRLTMTSSFLVRKGKLDRADVPSPDTILSDRFLTDMDTVTVTGVAPEVVVEATLPAAQRNCDQVKDDRSRNVGTLKLPAIYFPDGSYRLDENAKSAIIGIAERLESFPGLCIRIYGYTSSSGDRKLNEELSRMRAQAISKQLQKIDASSFKSSRLDVRGFGPANLVEVNGVEDAQASRRTEFTLYNPG